MCDPKRASGKLYDTGKKKKTLAVLLTAGPPMATVVNNWDSPQPNSNLLIYAVSLQEKRKQVNFCWLTGTTDLEKTNTQTQKKNSEFMVDL